MLPILFKIGPLKIHSYGLALVLAFYACYYLLHYDLKRLKYDPQLATDIIFFGAVCGILGSKIWYLIENIGAVLADPVGLIISGYGLVFFGGLIGGTLGVTWVLLRNKLDWLTFGDIVAPLLILGYAIGRTGCFMNGCCYGVTTALPWGIHYPHLGPGIQVHPTQLYELTLGLLIFLFLWRRRLRLKTTGSLFFTYLVLAGAERFLIEFIRINPKYLFNLSGAQWFALIIIAIGAYFLKYPPGKAYGSAAN
ncbi:MAG: prolipoprotein diacylglyceryl transferase [Candidatus Neomarinimicrobiota bacterium]